MSLNLNQEFRKYQRGLHKTLASEIFEIAGVDGTTDSISYSFGRANLLCPVTILGKFVARRPARREYDLS